MGSNISNGAKLEENAKHFHHKHLLFINNIESNTFSTIDLKFVSGRLIPTIKNKTKLRSHQKADQNHNVDTLTIKK